MDSQDNSAALIAPSKQFQQQGSIWIRSLCHSLLSKFHVMPTVRNRRNRNHKYAVPLLFTSPKLFPGSDDIDATTTTALTALPTSITEPEHRTLSSLLATNQNPSHRKPLPHTSPATIVKRFVKTTSTSKTLISSSSEISARVVQDHSYSALANLHRRDVLICLKSPHFVTGGKLDGTVVVDFPAGLSRPDLLESFHSFVIHLRGVESVVEPGRFRPETHTFQFLDRPILSLTGAEFVAMFRNDGKFVVPFVNKLPEEVGGSYQDKKGSVRYQLQVKMELRWQDRSANSNGQRQRKRGKTICSDHIIQIYLNSRSGPLSDGALCQPVRRTQHIWASPSSPTNAVHIDLNLARSLWVTDAPIYVHLELVNTSKDTVSDIKLELLRRQNTFSQTGLEGSFGLRPVTSILETVSEVLASSMGWILPIEPGMNDQAVMTLQSPGSRDRFTACSHKLIDESYSIRLSVMSSTRCSVDAVIEIPVVLAHPVSLDPPPGDYGTAITPSCQLIAPSMSLGMVHVGTPLPQKQPSAFHRVRGWISRCQSSQILSVSRRDLFSSPVLQSPIHLAFSTTAMNIPKSRGLSSRCLATSEKFEFGSMDLDCYLHYQQQQRALSGLKKSYPNAAEKFKKHALASSQYLKRLQNKTMSRAVTDPKLLTFPEQNLNIGKEKVLLVSLPARDGTERPT